MNSVQHSVLNELHRKFQANLEIESIPLPETVENQDNLNYENQESGSSISIEKLDNHNFTSSTYSVPIPTTANHHSESSVYLHSVRSHQSNYSSAHLEISKTEISLESIARDVKTVKEDLADLARIKTIEKENVQCLRELKDAVGILLKRELECRPPLQTDENLDLVRSFSQDSTCGAQERGSEEESCTAAPESLANIADLMVVSKKWFKGEDPISRNNTLGILMKEKDALSFLACMDAGGWTLNDMKKNTGCSWLEHIMEITKNDDFVSKLLRLSKGINLSWISEATQRNYLHIAANLNLVNTIGLIIDMSRNQGIIEDLVNKKDMLKFLPVHYTALRLSSKALEKFLKAKPLVDDCILSIGNFKKGPKIKQYSDYVRILIKYNALTTDMVNKPNAEGTTPLHLVVTNGDLDLVEKLVAVGARPEPGENSDTPIHLAIKLGHVEIANFLIKHFLEGRLAIDINFCNNEGNTYLHEAAQSCKQNLTNLNVVKDLIDQGAQLGVKNDKGETPVDLIFNHIQNPIEYIKTTILDPLIQVQFKGDLGNQGMRIVFNYNILNPSSGGRSGDQGSENFAFKTLCDNMFLRQERASLITHPLIESFVQLKFRKVRLIIYMQLLFTLLYTMIFSVYSATKCSIYVTEEEKYCLSYLRYLVFFIFLVMFMFDIFLKISRGRKVQFFSIFGPTVTILSVFTLLYDDGCSKYLSRSATATSVLLIWIQLFSVLSLEPNLGKDTLIFYRISKRLLILLLPYFLIIIGFACAFSIILREKDQFRHPITLINTILAMMLGELNYDDDKAFPKVVFKNESAYSTLLLTDLWNVSSEDAFTAHLIFFLFLFIISIVVSNILVAFAVQDVESVMKNVHIDQLLAQADYINQFESSKILRCVDFSIQPQYVVFPGLAESNHHIQKHVLENAMRINDGRETRESNLLRKGSVNISRTPSGWSKLRRLSRIGK